MKFRAFLSGALALALLFSATPAWAEPLTDEETPVNAEETLPAESPETPEESSPVITDEPDVKETNPIETNPIETTEIPEATETPEETLPAETEPAEEVVSVFTDEHTAYMNGYGYGKFGPNDTMTWGQVCTMVYSLLADQSAGTEEYTLTNTPEGQWYTTPMQVLASRGLLTVDPDPEADICRGDLVKLLCVCTGMTADEQEVPDTADEQEVIAPDDEKEVIAPDDEQEVIAPDDEQEVIAPEDEEPVITPDDEEPAVTPDEEEASVGFADVPEDSDYYEAVTIAVREGWVSGYPDGTFKPENTVTRAEAAVILNHVLNRSMDLTLSGDKTAVLTYTDVPEDMWCYNAVAEASNSHTYEITEDGTEVWTSYTPVYTVTFDVSGNQTVEYIRQGEKPWLPAGVSGVTHWMYAGSAEIVIPEETPVTKNVTYKDWYAPKLTTDHTQYVSGTGNGCFSPNQSLTRAEAAQMLYGMLADKSRGHFNCYFSDVESGSWYYEAVITLATRGLINDGCAFRPNDPMTRSEFVELLTRLVPYTDADPDFTDVDADDHYAAAIATAAELGWVTGYSDGSFGGSKNLTRAEAVVVFNHILNRAGDPTTESKMDSRYTFTDVPADHWAYQAIMEAATTHSFTWNGSVESWSTYTHKYSASVDWESSASVVAAASITNKITTTYSGNYTHSYNWDYSVATAEDYVNGKGYSSSTSYLIWVSRQNQKVYCFMGSKGNWKLYRTMICGTGKSSTPTPVGVTYITYRQESWAYSTDIVYKPVRFYPGTGYAMHSRLHYYGAGYYDASIGFPVSHGCVRMLDEDINFVYYYVPNNTTVVIY